MFTKKQINRATIGELEEMLAEVRELASSEAEHEAHIIEQRMDTLDGLA